MEYIKLQRDCQCNYCAGCNKLEDKNFTRTRNCSSYRPVIKKVWCADEVINQFNKTGSIK